MSRHSPAAQLPYSYSYSRRPDGIGTVLSEERERFDAIKERLKNLLLKQLKEFRFVFPFGRPEGVLAPSELRVQKHVVQKTPLRLTPAYSQTLPPTRHAGALKATLSLLERVMMKDMLTPAGTDDVRATIKHCLEESALLNYNNIVHAACALLSSSSSRSLLALAAAAAAAARSAPSVAPAAPQLAAHEWARALSSALACIVSYPSYLSACAQCRARAVRKRVEVPRCDLPFLVVISVRV